MRVAKGKAEQLTSEQESVLLWQPAVRTLFGSDNLVTT
jgi:hypothetical protein